MKQIVQHLKTGMTEVVDVPVPQNKPGNLIIETRGSLISAGTERMLVEFGKANYLDKARQQPEKFKQVLQKVKTDGLLPTIEAVQAKLDQPLALGYSNVGVVRETGSEGDGFSIGDRVVSNGSHAEFVRVPKNLCAKIPDNVDDESAAFTVVGAIALQGIRLLEPTLGEAVVVIGLGLVGLMGVQLLKANGCRVLGIDYDEARCKLAEEFGAEAICLAHGQDPVAGAEAFSKGRGVDGVLIAAATASDEPVRNAALMSRKRGRIVLVGVAGLKLNRDDFFKKEIRFQVSASYGPGRYDHNYEEKGQDYPIGFVRWTEQRNFEAVLDKLADGSLDVKPLISHRFSISNAREAYRVLQEAKNSMGILIEYPLAQSVTEKGNSRQNVILISTAPESFRAVGTPKISFIGAGNYATRALIPAFKKAGVALEQIVATGGLNAVYNGKKYGFKMASTDVDGVFNDSKTDTVAIVTQHDTHASFVTRALREGKNIFVEKPLALTLTELSQIEESYHAAFRRGESPQIMVGFNRRFAPMITKMKKLLSVTIEPKTILITVNAGEIPSDHWTQNPEVGGGRIIGEGCHFIDLARHLVGYSITDFKVTAMGGTPRGGIHHDKVAILLSFEDGSFATICYLANGSKSFPKERIEVFCNNGVLQLDNFRSLKGYGWAGFQAMRSFTQDKGQTACVAAFVNAIKSGSEAPIPFEQIMEVSRVTIEAAQRIQEK